MKPILSLLPLIFLLASCGEEAPPQATSLQEWEGYEVTVYFKRDLLGAAGSPIAPTTTWLNNTKVSLDGKIIKTRLDGIFFDSHHKMNSGDSDLHHSVFWIPHESILTVELKK